MSLQTCLRVVFAAATIAVGAISAHGQAEHAEPPAPDGDAILERMAAHYKALPGVSVTAVSRSVAMANAGVQGGPTKDKAVDRGRELAKDAGGELRIKGRDGRIQDPDSYGNDPNPPRDRRP